MFKHFNKLMTKKKLLISTKSIFLKFNKVWPFKSIFFKKNYVK
jgi:hypothetical protein